jgi:hypothetical protein
MIRLFRSDLFTFYPSYETRLLVLVLVAGSLGSSIHAVTSFVAYVGNRELYVSWIWWYLLRPFIGMALAALFYLVVRGGFFSTSSQPGSVNPYGIAALAGLVGMFSKQATEKLNELFTNLFRTEQKDQKKDKLTDNGAANKKPTITSFDPPSITAATALSLTVQGTNFVKESIVLIDQINLTPELKSPTELVVTIKASDIPTGGDKSVTVVNPENAGGVSEPKTLKVE